MREKLTIQELELLNTASAYNGAQHKEICGKATLELIEYKKIEQELGIDLTLLFKALKNGIYIKDDGDIIVDITDDCLYLTYRNERWLLDHYVLGGFYITDYGKTWALTEEELL